MASAIGVGPRLGGGGGVESHPIVAKFLLQTLGAYMLARHQRLAAVDKVCSDRMSARSHLYQAHAILMPVALTGGCDCQTHYRQHSARKCGQRVQAVEMRHELELLRSRECLASEMGRGDEH